MSRYIDAEWTRNVYADFNDYDGRDDWTTPITNVLAVIDDAPSIDIVRCQDCRHRYMDADLQVWTCTYGLMIKPNGFCNYGERKESE